jgi:hypothetical protein
VNRGRSRRSQSASCRSEVKVSLDKRELAWVKGGVEADAMTHKTHV